MQKVLVCGGRTFKNWRLLYSTLIKLFKHIPRSDITIIHGGAKGADSMAAAWADANKINTIGFYAEWSKYGKKAGYLRNQRMLDEGKPDLVVAFPGGKGTAMMIDIAKKAGVEVLEIKE